MKFKVFVLLILLIVGIGLFYWFQVRPNEIRSYCNWYAKWGWNGSRGLVTDKPYDDHYNSCLHESGLK